MIASVRRIRLASACLCIAVYLMILAVVTVSSRHDDFWQELFGSTEGQFAIGVIGFMLVMGGWMLVMALKKSRGKG